MNRRTAINRIPVAAGLLLLAAFGWFTLAHTSFAVGGTDSAGYFNAARLIAQGAATAKVTALDTYALDDSFLAAFIPLGMVPGRYPRSMAPLYPIGFPAHVAAAALLSSWDWVPFLISPLAAVVLLILQYRLGREFGLSAAAAAGAAIILASCPFLVFQAIQQMSDCVGAFWSVLGVLAALAARRQRTNALLAGAAFGVALLVRPTSFLLLIPIGLALPASVRVWSMFLAGVLPSAAAFLLFNFMAYGDPLQTGYGIAGLTAFMSPATALNRGAEYLSWLARTTSPLLIAGCALVFTARRIKVRDRILLASWAFGFLLFYSVYSYVPEVSFWDLRYLLPAIPAVIAAALLGWDELARRLPVRLAQLNVLVLPVVVLMAAGSGAFYVARQGILNTAEDQSRYPKASLWVKETIPAGSLVLSRELSGALLYYTRVTPVRWDFFDPGKFALLRRAAEARGDGIYALLLPYEVPLASRGCPGAWSRIGDRMNVALYEVVRGRSRTP